MAVMAGVNEQVDVLLEENGGHDEVVIHEK
jgi:hypothetical protein